MSRNPEQPADLTSSPVTRFFVIAFCMALTLPMLARMAVEIEPYGRKPFTTVEKPVAAMTSGDAESYKKLANAQFERSWFVREAISTKNKALYFLFRYIDTNQIISGRDGWLFYKSQFADGACLDKRTAQRLANAIATTSSMALSIGIPVTISMSPDKSVIYPEKVHPRAAYLSACKDKSSETLRDALASRVPAFIDHKQPIVENRSRHPSEDLYYQTGTHWNALGSYYALRQLSAQLLRQDEESFPVPLLSEASGKTQHNTDMAEILGLEKTEPKVRIIASQLEAIGSALKLLPGRTVIVHDSFYGSTKISRFFKSGHSVVGAVRQQNATLLKHLAKEENVRIIVNFIERNFIEKMGYLFLDDPQLLRYAIDQNRARASKFCRYNDNIDQLQIQKIRIEGKDRNFRSTSTDPYMIVKANADVRRRCIKISIRVDRPARMTVFLPPLHGTKVDQAWEAGREFNIDLKSGRNKIDLILPPNIRGSLLRIDPINHLGPFQIDALSFGEMTPS